MAALRQLLNAKELTGSLYPRALPEESRQMVKAKMEAMGHEISPPAVPQKEQSNVGTHNAQNLRPVKYSREEPSSKAGTSFEDYDRSIYTSIYEERLSRDLTPGATSLPYRPNVRNNSETQLNKAAYSQRRRSRSLSGDHNPWNDYSPGQNRGLTRKDSGRSSSQPPKNPKDGSGSLQALQDRQRSPQSNNGAFEPLSSIGHPKKRNTKNSNNSTTSFNPTGSDHSTKSNTDSVASGIKHTVPPLDRSSRKRSRDLSDLDYTPEQLQSKTYADLMAEPFDHNPPSFFSENPLTKRLPSTSLPLQSRLQAVYDSSTSRVALAKTFFASMPIETYDESGDLLLEKFADLLEKLKEARRAKRKACMAMEEEVSLRERWVRGKRTCVEEGLDQLRTTGMSVIKPKVGRV